jgi:hypothetical protein
MALESRDGAAGRAGVTAPDNGAEAGAKARALAAGSEAGRGPGMTLKGRAGEELVGGGVPAAGAFDAGGGVVAGGADLVVGAGSGRRLVSSFEGS